MKIGIVCYPSLGGSGVLATELGHQLALRGHEVHFITYEMPFRLRLENPNIFFHEVEINQYELFKYPDYALALAVKIANVSKHYNLDILHVHYAIPHATSAYLAKQILGTEYPKIITTLHGTDITLVGKEPAFFEMVKFSIEQSHGVTCVSLKLCKETCSHFHICCNVEIIHNFFIPQADLIGKKPLRNDFVKEGESLLIHSSNYRSVKRPEDIINIFMKIQQRLPAKLLLLGSGPGLETIRQFVEKYQLEDRVIFIGNSINVDPYIASSDLFLLPSEQESFGLGALEAMAYGVPVIATRVGGLPEVVEDNSTGFLSEVGDIEKMADDAIHLLTNTSLYQEFSKEASLRAARHFSAEKILPQYEEYYARILQI